ncbi:valine--tRNA ligase [Candidatus Pacearchaeota archaeon]|nr:valine--tRNA ligase [Candidatus Pacearchaeota archaeon]
MTGKNKQGKKIKKENQEKNKKKNKKKKRKKYDFNEIETKWVKYWEENKIYKFDSNDTKKAVFSVDTPPPTISGSLHMGHAFGDAQQDFFVRFKRMKGFNVLNPFGTDNNGLPTLRLVEKENDVDSKSMKREDFIELSIKTIKEKYIPEFLEEIKRLGVSADFDIFYSTIDERSRRISQQSFIELYNQGREYRVDAPALWCPNCQTTIAQVELEDKDVSSEFSDIMIKADGEDLIISTTRPELFPASVAVFYNPKDKRYKHLKGKKAKIPLFDIEVPILEDEEVDMEKGTGIAYCATFGDQTDMEWQKQYNLPIKKAITSEGRMSSIAGKYKGMKIKEARKKILKDLKNKGLLVKQEKIMHPVNVCERCGTEIEFINKKQWFIKYLDLKKEMLEWGKEINWTPENMVNRYNNWVKGLKWDWCISRQIPFGIPFPVWYCKKCDEIVLADKKDLPIDPLESDPPVDKCPNSKCNSKEFIPETDIMNTWATSAMTPTIVKDLLKGTKVYEKIKDKPFDVRRNGQDIITFWDFNTVVKSQLHYKRKPWKELYINGWILGRDGHKMSKSRGNGISPKKVIKEHGADALRYLSASIGPGVATSFSDKDLIAGKKLVKKMINASRFVFMNLQEFNGRKPKNLEIIDKLFLTKVGLLIQKVTNLFEEYEPSKAKLAVEQFFWQDFCDNYLEIVKKRVYQGEGDEKKSAQYALYKGLLAIVKMIAPIMPFITEEIYQEYFKKYENDKSIHISSWPKPEYIEQKNLDEVHKFAHFVEILEAIRKWKTKEHKSMNSEIILTLTKKSYEELEEMKMLGDLKNVSHAVDIKQGK